MAPLVCRLNQLHPSITTSAIAVRVVRAYEVPLNGSYEHPMSVECVLHDREGVRIHASLGRNLLKSVAVKLKEGNCFLIHKFYTRANHMRFKTTDNAYRIVLTQKTDICEVPEADFPNYMFSFKMFPEISAIQNIVDTALFDVIGVIVGSPGVVNQPNSKMLELHLEDEMHNPMTCTLWENYVDEFLSQVDTKILQVPIVVVQFCRATLYKGEVRVCTSYNVSKVSFNKDTKEIQAMRDRIVGDKKFLECMSLTFTSLPKDPAEEVENLDVKTIEDLFCLEDGCYWICGKIDHIESNGDWFYMACKRCSKKVSKVDQRFFCDRCNKYEGVATKRFMLRVNVVDATGNATLLLWDRECVQLLGKKAWECDAVVPMGRDPTVIPNEIEENLVERFVLFKVQMRNDSEFRLDQPYTVSKICTTSEVLEKYVAAVISSQQESWTRSLDDISFGCDIEKISDSQSVPMYGEEFEGILEKGKGIIDYGKRELEQIVVDCTGAKKMKVKEEKE